MGNRTLVIGIGNNSRGDDGLGWACLDRLAERPLGAWQLEYRYQLAPEDAELLTQFPAVLFIDACASALPGGFSLEPCPPDPGAGLYTHQQTPGAVLHLCRELYGRQPQAWLLRIQGHKWTLGTGLTKAARSNLKQAVAHLFQYFQEPLAACPGPTFLAQN